MHNIRKKRYGTEITEQRLCDQTRMIRKNESITKLELENIRRKILQKEKNIKVGNHGNTGERFITMRRIYARKRSTRLIQRN